MATFAKGTKKGVVEPNHVSAQRTGQIYAQLPCKSTITELENGTFVKYDYATGEVNFTGAGEWMLVMNEVKLYNEQHQLLTDFSVKTTDAPDGKIYPRVYKTNVGDIFTTNQVKDEAIVAGNKLVPGTAGVLEVKASPTATEMVWSVVALTTLPDAVTPAVKLQRIQ